MEIIQAYYNGSVFVPLNPVNVRLNQSAIITILDTDNTTPSGNHYSEFFGTLSAESYSEIIEALNDTETVDENEW